MDENKGLSDELKALKNFRTEMIWESRIQTIVLILSLFGITTLGILIHRNGKK